MRLHDDFVELRPGGISRLEQLFTEYFSCTSGSGDGGDVVDPSATSKVAHPGGAVSWTSQLCWKFWPAAKKTSNLPRHYSSKRSAEELGTCPMIPETPQMDHNFVLLCIPFMRLASKLWQAEICRINSDRDFFRVLRYFYNHRGKRPWARLRKVQAVHFVKVSVIVFVHFHVL